MWSPPSEDIRNSGVVTYEKQKAFQGLNLYNSRNSAEAYLMDMEGHRFHTWRSTESADEDWQHMELLEDGDLLVVVKDQKLMRLRWDSHVKWEQKGRFHHDVAVSDSGEIFALSREEKVVPYKGRKKIPLLVDIIVVLSKEGKIKNEISLFETFKGKIKKRKLKKVYKWSQKNRIFEKLNQSNEIILHHDVEADIFHTNSIEVMPKSIEGMGERGDLLLSAREIDMIAVVGIEDGQIKWSWGPKILHRQHHPTLLKNGNILVFDNGKKSSKIIELDPLSKSIQWVYQSDPPKRFFSRKRGGNQRLPNGNTLITDSLKGYVFEIDSQKNIVWEFYNPEFRKKEKRRATINRMERVTDPKTLHFLELLKKWSDLFQEGD